MVIDLDLQYIFCLSYYIMTKWIIQMEIYINYLQSLGHRKYIWTFFAFITK